MKPVVAIDGPAGVGKSTVARRLARTLGVPYISTGLMYRAVAERALKEGVDPDDEEALAEIARRLRFGIDTSSNPRELTIDGRPPDSALESAGVEAVVSRVSSHPEVRRVLRERQRSLGRGGCVMEGRDIGPVVLPEAPVKVLLVASPEIRAGRRERERGRGGVASTVAARDRQDSRTTPLTPAPDTHILDTSGMSPDEVYEEIVALLRTRGVT